MSLSFVKSAVLTSTDGVSHNEETKVDSKETEALRKRGDTKSLYAQLQANQEAAEEQQEEERRAMRDALMLNEDDAAFLENVESTKMAKLEARQQNINEELESFRKAKAFLKMSKEEQSSRSSSNEHLMNHKKQEVEGQPPARTVGDYDDVVSNSVPALPVRAIIKKKRRRVVPQEEEVDNNNKKQDKKEVVESRQKEEEPADNALSLLGTYSYSSDEEGEN